MYNKAMLYMRALEWPTARGILEEGALRDAYGEFAAEKWRKTQ
jgi:hypothetical protein